MLNKKIKETVQGFREALSVELSKSSTVKHRYLPLSGNLRDPSQWEKSHGRFVPNNYRKHGEVEQILTVLQGITS